MVSLLLLLSSLHPIDSCMATRSVLMANPATCSALCAPSLLLVPGRIFDTPSMLGLCAVRTLFCSAFASPIATITFNGGAGIVSGISSVSLVITCNSSGTAWTYMGIAITSVTCT